MHPILLLLIGLTVLTSFKGFNDISFFRKYEFHIGSIRAGENVRMFSSAFLHADWGHLFFNMFTLYMFAPVVINYLDSFYFMVIYIGSLVCGSLLTLLFHKDEFSYRAIGASCAVTGFLYSAIVFGRGYGIRAALRFQSLSQIAICFPDSKANDYKGTVASVLTGVCDYAGAEEVSKWMGQTKTGNYSAQA